MGITTKKTKEQFIEESRKVHGDKYDYSKVEYINNNTKVKIICPIHGEFEQTPKNHKQGKGCKLCGYISNGNLKRKNNIKKNKKRKNKNNFILKEKYKGEITQEEFICFLYELYGDKYDYSKVEYKNKKTKVCITCPIHGDFLKSPYLLLKGKSCPKCIREKITNEQRFTIIEFIEHSKKTHGSKYDYSKAEYINNHTKVKIICPIHGEFFQRPQDHINGQGCPKCSYVNKRNNFSLGKNNFVEKANKKFNNFFSYENVEYLNNSKKVSITCPIHGDFLCTPKNHLKGRGCPICKIEKNVYENRLYNLLLTIFNEEEIIRQYKSDWLTRNKSLDFFIPKYNIAIEHQGIQHFKPQKYFGGEEKFKKTCELDKEKYKECCDNKIELFYFSYEEIKIPLEYFSKIYFNEEEFLNKIKEKIIV